MMFPVVNLHLCSISQAAMVDDNGDKFVVYT